EALDRADELYAQGGGAGAIRLKRAQVRQQRGEVLRELDEFDRSAGEYQEGLRLLEGLAGEGQAGERVWGDLQHSRGVLCSELPGRRAESLKHFEEALKVRLRLAQQTKSFDDRGDL